MNKTRRRVGKARRKKARLIREMREWTKTAWTELPKRGRLRAPARRLAEQLDTNFARGFARVNAMLAPLFGRALGGGE